MPHTYGVHAGHSHPITARDLICMPYMYSLYACIPNMPYMQVYLIRLICMCTVYALYVCIPNTHCVRAGHNHPVIARDLRILLHVADASADVGLTTSAQRVHHVHHHCHLLRRWSNPYLNPKPETRNPKPETRNPKPETRNPKP